MAHSDYEFAALLQSQFNQEVAVENPPKSLTYTQPEKPQNDDKSLTDPSWELIDPTPNIHVLFVAFDGKYFWGKLSTVCVSWSKRMTSCAGICSYQGSGGFCHITLSEPLLKLRPRKDLIETLLHEMIHAYLFVTRNNTDHDGHGPEFHKHMYRINKDAGTNITVYHSFHDEVNLYKQHWWKCTGPCQNRKPYYGMVKRAMNRAPGPNDNWWEEHKRNCNGVFIKVKEPEKKPKMPLKETVTKSSNDIRNFYPAADPNTIDSKEIKKVLTSNDTEVIVIDSDPLTPTDYSVVRNSWLKKFPPPCNTKRSAGDNLDNAVKKKQSKVEGVNPGGKVWCPICDMIFLSVEINSHLDICLNKDVINTIEDDSLTQCKKETKYECPVCFQQFTFEDMSNHLENCLGNDTDVSNDSFSSFFNEPF